MHHSLQYTVFFSIFLINLTTLTTKTFSGFFIFIVKIINNGDRSRIIFLFENFKSFFGIIFKIPNSFGAIEKLNASIRLF